MIFRNSPHRIKQAQAAVAAAQEKQRRRKEAEQARAIERRQELRARIEENNEDY